MTSMLARWPDVRASLADDGFAALHPPGDVAVVAPDLVEAPAAAARQQESPMPLTFGLPTPMSDPRSAVLFIYYTLRHAFRLMRLKSLRGGKSER